MRPVRALAALALVVTALGIAPHAEAAGTTGKLTIAVLDAQGDPDVGQVQVLGPDGYVTGSGSIGESTMTVDVPPGAYAVVALTPWGGFSCSGLDTCSYLALAGGGATPNGDVTVAAGGQTTATVQAAAPAAITGGRTVGDTLSVDFSEGLDEFYAILGGAALVPSVQWLRNGAPIRGAIGDTYVPVGADSGKVVAARLAYTGVALSYVQQLSGNTTVPPVTTPGVSVRKRSSQTYVRMVRSTFTAGEQGVVRIDVTAPGEIVTGKVQVAVGKWKDTRVLRNGRAVVRLPALATGTYQVTAAFLGSDSYAASKAKPRTITVTKK